MAQILVALANSGIDYTMYRRHIRKQLLNRKLRDHDTIIGGVPYYQDITRNFQYLILMDTSYNISVILTHGDDKSVLTNSNAKQTQAVWIYDRLVAGEDFAKLARTFSIDPSAENGGLIEDVPGEQLSSEFFDVLAWIEPGEITQPIKVSGGQNVIVRLNGFQPPQMTKLLTEARVHNIFLRPDNSSDLAVSFKYIQALKDQIDGGGILPMWLPRYPRTMTQLKRAEI